MNLFSEPKRSYVGEKTVVSYMKTFSSRQKRDFTPLLLNCVTFSRECRLLLHHFVCIIKYARELWQRTPHQFIDTPLLKLNVHRAGEW